MEASKIDIAELAELLEDRKNKNQKTMLILGSRAGALFRSSIFADEMSQYSNRSFVDISEMDRFSECYSILETEKRKIGREDLKIIITQSLREINFSAADDCLAELIGSGIFKIVVSNNVDDLLYGALTAIDLKEKHDFVDFPFGRLSIEDTVDAIVTHKQINACKFVRFCGDVDTFIYNLGRPQEQQRHSQCLKLLLERLRIKELLLVGLDVRWDAAILAALPTQIKAVWFVNEDERVRDAFIAMHKHLEHFRFIVGGNGGYEKFFKALHWQVNQGIPRHYELTGRLQNQLHVMQNDLAHMKDLLKDIHEDIKRIQTHITRLTRRVEEIAEQQKNAEE